MSLKYIAGISLLTDEPREVAVIFPSVLVHADVARRLHFVQVLGAGSCRLGVTVHEEGSPDHQAWEAFGGSESLGVASRRWADSALLNRQQGIACPDVPGAGREHG